MRWYPYAFNDNNTNVMVDVVDGKIKQLFEFYGQKIMTSKYKTTYESGHT